MRQFKQGIVFFIIMMCSSTSFAEIMSYVIEGDVTSISPTSIIADTNISEPASVRGFVVYDTTERGAVNLLAASYNLISVTLIVESQTNVVLNVSTKNAKINYLSYGQDTSTPQVDAPFSDDIEIAWSGSGLINNTSEYTPESMSILLPRQDGVLQPSMAADLTSMLGNDFIRIYLNGAVLESNITSLKVISGDASPRGNSPSSGKDGGGSFSLTGLVVLTVSLLSFLISSRFREI